MANRPEHMLSSPSDAVLRNHGRGLSRAAAKLVYFESSAEKMTVVRLDERAGLPALLRNRTYVQMRADQEALTADLDEADAIETEARYRHRVDLARQAAFRSRNATAVGRALSFVISKEVIWGAMPAEGQLARIAKVVSRGAQLRIVDQDLSVPEGMTPTFTVCTRVPVTEKPSAFLEGNEAELIRITDAKTVERYDGVAAALAKAAMSHEDSLAYLEELAIPLDSLIEPTPV